MTLQIRLGGEGGRASGEGWIRQGGDSGGPEPLVGQYAHCSTDPELWDLLGWIAARAR